MFDNYPQYREEIASAIRHASPFKKRLMRATALCTAMTVIAAIGVFAAADAMSSGQRETLVRSTVAEALANEEQPIEVSVADGFALSDLLGAQEKAETDESAVEEQIRADVTPADIEAAPVRVLDETTAEVTIQTSEGFDVKVTVKTDDAGNATVTRIEATVSASRAPKKQDGASDPAQLELERERFASPLTSFDEESLLAAIEYVPADGTDDVESRADAVRSRLAVLNRAVVLALPARFVEEGVADNVPAQGRSPESQLKEQSRTWNSQDSGIITVRSERLDATMRGLGGKQAAEKLVEYWKETSGAVAAGAGQAVSDEGYKAKLFYDPATGMWGYQGTVEFLDGDKIASYKRVVLVDDVEGTAVTVSYRLDRPSSAAVPEGALTSEGLWKMVGVLPQVPEYMIPVIETKLGSVYETPMAEGTAQPGPEAVPEPVSEPGPETVPEGAGAVPGEEGAPEG